jgi:hypothetical protein
MRRKTGPAGPDDAVGASAVESMALSIVIVAI